MEEDEDYDRLIKLIIIGDSGVGKTNLLTRFTENRFSLESKATIGVEFSSKNVMVGEQKIKVQIWDTAGQERYQAITDAYYKGAKGAMIIYDITKEGTFESLDKWYTKLTESADANIVIMACGNKTDLVDERQVSKESAEDFAKDKEILFVETSALDNNNGNVEAAFMQVVKSICDKYQDSDDDFTDSDDFDDTEGGKDIGETKPVQVKINLNSKTSGSKKKKKKGKCC